MQILQMNQHRKSIFITSVILPVLLFTALGFTTISNGPPNIAETKTLEIVVWNATRTGDMFQHFDQFLTPTYVDNEISASYLLIIGEYVGETITLGSPYLGIPAEINASVASPSSFIYDINVSFHQEDSVIWVPPLNTTTLAFPLEGLSLTTVYGGPNAYMYLLGQNNSRSVSFLAAPWWLFTSNSTLHSLRVNFTITYFNGTLYKRLVQPFQLNVL